MFLYVEFITTRRLPLYWTSCSSTTQADWFSSNNSHLHTWVSCFVGLFFSPWSFPCLSETSWCVASVRVAQEVSLWSLQGDSGSSAPWSAHPGKHGSEGTARRPVRAPPGGENQPGDTWAPSSGTSRTLQASFHCAHRRTLRQGR